MSTTRRRSSPPKLDAAFSLGLGKANVPAVQKKLIEGLPFAELERFESESTLPKQTILDTIRLPTRTLARRKVDGKLTFAESERLLRLARVFKAAVDLYNGKIDTARQWLETPLLALGNSTPLEMTQSEVGAHEVLDLIGRLEHGVYS